MARMNLDDFRAGSTEPWCVDILTAFLHALEPPRIIELGTFEGRTTKRLAEAAQDFGGHVTTVELDYERIGKAKKHCAGLENITFHQYHTLAFLNFWNREPFDFAFVDDDHSADHVRQELKLLQNVMAPGGFIFVHDVVGPFGLDTVVREAGGYVLPLPQLHVAGGLGVIVCPR